MKRQIGYLGILHLFGNALVLWLGYYWLGIGESNGAHLAWSAFLFFAIFCAAAWLHGTALALFHRDFPASLGSAAVTALCHLAPLFVIATIAAGIYGLLAYWHDSFGHSALVIGSYLTLKLRKPVSPVNVLRWYHALIWFLRWLIVPAVLAPLAASIARFGWHGFRFHALRRTKDMLYCVAVCGLLLLGIWVPLKLILWVPEISHFAWQMMSFLARLGVGYLLFVVAVLSLEFLTSAGKPRFSQSSTASWP